MQHIAVYFDAPGFDDYPFGDSDFRTAYFDIGAALHAKGVTFSIVRSPATYQGGTSFSRGWTHDGTTFQESGPLTVDLVWDKGHFKGDAGIPRLNDLELEEICTDKWKTFELFGRHCPETQLICDIDTLQAALTKAGSDRVVIKPVDGEEGKGVQIDTASHIDPATVSLPCIMQTFIDTSGGVPGLVDGMHDFRIISLGGEIAASYIRTPPDGSLVANVAQGGKEITLNCEDIPESAKAVYTDVDAVLSRFPLRLYSLDMGLDRDGTWRIIELNAKPGPPSPQAPKPYRHFLDMLVVHFEKTLGHFGR